MAGPPRHRVMAFMTISLVVGDSWLTMGSIKIVNTTIAVPSFNSDSPDGEVVVGKALIKSSHRALMAAAILYHITSTIYMPSQRLGSI